MPPDFGKLLLRITFGGIMITHGWPKALKLVSDWGHIEFADPMGIGATASLILAVFAELVCAVLVVIGYKTRLATIPLIITMVIAAFVIHAKDPFGNKEMAILYLGAYLAIALLGPGKWSADRK
ncbi:MAG TPA: DoxX family protein [Cryomorphaceae bacterium]|nr:DoxX family protein [Owenweeksia sp.]MBF98061.1 DoxX family protein [Owenweeksia sp.]HAD97241.1 DoxX family protein [Cryomorphaceae bacterium]HBF21274.1 DoxX family protein [Cryomorphaceae bacterium]HCQ15482.1 DoxX family protein [Cryomorphaceae bacterium]|tara:strand:+ start:158 stop:529 length:372 start_codon:yes stop_codon:yes gene_type:complete